MDWFKHKTGSLDDPDLADAVDKHGDAAYLFFFGVLEIYGREFSRLKDGWLIISLTFLRRKLRKSSAKVEQMLNVYREKNRILSEISGDTVRIKIPKFIELASDWSGRYARKVSATPTEAPTEAPTAIEVEVEREVDKDLKTNTKDIVKDDKKPSSITIDISASDKKLALEISQEQLKSAVLEIVSYLNQKTGAAYKPTTPTTVKLIHARLNEKHTIDDFRRVIDKKVAEWGNDPRFSKYLRPITLFSGKFEGYLNQPDEKSIKTIDPIYDEIDRLAKEAAKDD